MLIPDSLVVHCVGAGTRSLNFFEKTIRIGPRLTASTSLWQWVQIGAPIGTMSLNLFRPSKPFWQKRWLGALEF
jgi:hypothetical protein